MFKEGGQAPENNKSMTFCIKKMWILGPIFLSKDFFDFFHF